MLRPGHVCLSHWGKIEVSVSFNAGWLPLVKEQLDYQILGLDAISKMAKMDIILFWESIDQRTYRKRFCILEKKFPVIYIIIHRGMGMLHTETFNFMIVEHWNCKLGKNVELDEEEFGGIAILHLSDVINSCVCLHENLWCLEAELARDTVFSALPSRLS